MWLWPRKPPQKPQPHEVNQVRLFGPLLHLEALTRGQMWWKSFFTIGFTLELMEFLLMVHVNQGSHRGC
jgi:hypothetical protein